MNGETIGCPVQVVSTVNRKDNEVSNDETRIEASAKIEAERHQPEPGGCTCGFCSWSVEHVVVMSVRAALAASLPVPTEDVRCGRCAWCLNDHAPRRRGYELTCSHGFGCCQNCTAGCRPSPIAAVPAVPTEPTCEHGLVAAHHWTWGDTRYDCPGPVPTEDVTP